MTYKRNKKLTKKVKILAIFDEQDNIEESPL